MSDEQYYKMVAIVFFGGILSIFWFIILGRMVASRVAKFRNKKDKDFNQSREEKYHYDLGYTKAQADSKKARLDFERTLALMHIGYPVIGISQHRAHPVVGILKRVLTRDQSSPFAIHPGLMIQDYITGEEVEFYGATYVFSQVRLMAVCRLSPEQRASLWSTGLVVEYDRLVVKQEVMDQWVYAGLHYPQINEILTKAGFYNLAHFQTQEETEGN
jgi:hypothetical protein